MEDGAYPLAIFVMELTTVEITVMSNEKFVVSNNNDNSNNNNFNFNFNFNFIFSWLVNFIF